jgi:hypothetical protein
MMRRLGISLPVMLRNPVMKLKRKGLGTMNSLLGDINEAKGF